MNIKIHRGLNQIGGCITEISTETSRIFIDMGQNLPGVGEQTSSEQDHKMVADIFEHNKKKHQAVFYTHGHEDHVGLFFHVPSQVPQFCGEGTKEILLAKYESVKKGHELNLNVCSSLAVSGEKQMHRDAVIRIKDEIAEDDRKIKMLKAFKTWERTKPRCVPKYIEIGDIRITPFFNSHSIYDSYMFLIEAEGKRIWHTGDYRGHGYLGKGLIPTLKKYATNIDTLITEGTMLNRDEECIHESEVMCKMTNVMKAFKYVIVLASATDIDRLATIRTAAQFSNHNLYICSGFMKQTMKIFTRREKESNPGLYDFHPKYVTFDDPKIDTMNMKGFVLIAGPSQQAFVEELTSGLNPSEVLLIYSSWDGYYKDPAQVALNPRYKNFRDAFSNVVDIHTSGHADRNTIKKVIDIVKAKDVIIIHKEGDSTLKQ